MVEVRRVSPLLLPARFDGPRVASLISRVAFQSRLDEPSLPRYYQIKRRGGTRAVRFAGFAFPLCSALLSRSANICTRVTTTIPATRGRFILVPELVSFAVLRHAENLPDTAGEPPNIRGFPTVFNLLSNLLSNHVSNRLHAPG